ncbi:hypothetical protein F0L68_21425 [Solihabitans fulvus]|uniref:SalK n=1 Tax=Solihabitans fulvus TaxID=1892852 RepID=A0A5B2X895_9PSEU|nr:hypothetical protein [Solihabitans fulvus]KAA2259494.1 hypothetical protein F0L68_21425 [Solihabitans fulvus]
MDDLASARRIWAQLELYHGVTYFGREGRAVTDELGCKGGWMGYFGTRAAPLGAASPELVTAVFYNFHPARVARAVPDTWRIAAPERYLAARLDGVDRALRRILGDDVVAGDAVAEAAELAVAAAGLVPLAGRPLGAANAALPWSDQPHLALWQATTVVREARGDGHFAALSAALLDGCETLVVFASDHGVDADYMRQARGWSTEEWAAATDRLVDRGLLTEAGGLTDAGRELRAWVELRTDEAAVAPWTALGADRATRLGELLDPLLRDLVGDNRAVLDNPMLPDVATVFAER